MRYPLWMMFALAGGLGLAAEGQLYAGQDGHALDANPRVGSNGRNVGAPIDARFDYRLANDVVTGNLSGFSYFRDELGYTAPGEFRDELGSDDTFRFRASSVPTAPTENLLRVYRGASRPMITPGTDTRVLLDAQSLFQVNDSQLIQPLYSSTQNNSLGLVRVGENQAAQVEVSPLLGIQLQYQPVRPVSVQDFQSDEPLVPLDTQDDSNTPGVQLDIQPIDTQVIDGATSLLPQPSQALDVEAQLFNQVQENFGRRSLERNTYRTPPAAVLGRDIQRQLLQPTTEAAANAAQYDQWRQNLINAPDQLQQQGSVYGQLVQDAFDPNAQTNNALDAQPGDLPFALPDESQVSQAERLGLTAREEAFGLTTSNELRQRLLNPDEDQEDEETSFTPGEGQTPLDYLIDELDYNLPSVQTLVGDRSSQMAEVMAEAEQVFIEGDYFHADRLYQQASRIEPNDPMAQVGRIHSLMGAGMIRTSSLLLHRLFEDHPELIAARYDEALLPTGERLQALNDNLNTLIAESDGGAEAGVMLAYLGYQLRSQTLVRYGLAIAESHTPEDTLLPLLRRIWLDRE